MAYHLPSHVSFGFLGDRAVALDLVADRYFLISPPETAALVAWCGAVSEPAHCVALGALVRRGLLAAGEGAPITPVAAAMLRRAAIEAPATGSYLPLLELAGLRASAALHLRMLGLNRTLSRWRALARRLARRPRSAAADADAIRIAQGFADARVLLPARQLCVPESLALARALWRRGIDADIYFGVRLAPFMAHAWVQRGDLLLSDTLNTVGEYTPVFRL